MKKEDVVVGRWYQCKVKEDMEAPFSAQVDKLYENSALMTITDYNNKTDELNVEDLNHRIVVNFKHFIKEDPNGPDVPKPESVAETDGDTEDKAEEK